ncbi:antibiotic biosynthesis monooxygenase [Azoarcus indigens]|uniref:Quinol monooxygenase YgiN n=1 Tax=Azoarcus indigens TaxID=29545 RepID=A0A4R6DZT8_9RHOO|nr:putative quinol monooxygenase [Azoarcus indigens]NMG64695.1 antibiotic biosynthesis monooxygenase [Azoarcus indigens]TDN50920.1 quinol monooxygenase YgiN [Azoarcus indigens]
MSGLLDVVAIVQAKPGGEEAVGAALARCAEASRREAGCQWYRLHKDRDVAGRYVVIERWRDRSALAAHEATEHFQALGGVLAEHGSGDIQILLLDEIG